MLTMHVKHHVLHMRSQHLRLQQANGNQTPGPSAVCFWILCRSAMNTGGRKAPLSNKTASPMHKLLRLSIILRHIFRFLFVLHDRYKVSHTFSGCPGSAVFTCASNVGEPVCRGTSFVLSGSTTVIQNTTDLNSY